MTTILVYHCPCRDGIYSAFAAWLHFKNHQDLVWIPYNHGDTLSDRVPSSARTLFLLDCAGPEGFALEMADRGIMVVVLDHHKTALEDLCQIQHPNIDITHIDSGKSGARIALEYFRPEISPEVSEMYDYVEDIDIWRNMEMDDRKAFNLGANELAKDEALSFDINQNPGIFEQLQELRLTRVLDIGWPLFEKQKDLIEEYVRKSFVIALGSEHSGWGHGLAVIIEDPDHYSQYCEIGHALAQKSSDQGMRDIAAVSKYRGDDEVRRVSLRSVSSDTTVISKTYGGGGHMCASGFAIDAKEFDAWRRV